MPEVEGEHFSYTVAGKAEAARKKAALKKKKSAAKKKKPVAKKKAYRTGGLEERGAGAEKVRKGAVISQLATAARNLSSTKKVNPAYARWLERKASVRNHFPNTDAGNRKLLQAIGPAPSKTMPSKTVPKKKYARGGVTTPPTKQATRRAKYKKQAKSLLKKQRTS